MSTQIRAFVTDASDKNMISDNNVRYVKLDLMFITMTLCGENRRITRNVIVMFCQR